MDELSAGVYSGSLSHISGGRSLPLAYYAYQHDACKKGFASFFASCRWTDSAWLAFWRFSSEVSFSLPVLFPISFLSFCSSPGAGDGTPSQVRYESRRVESRQRSQKARCSHREHRILSLDIKSELISMRRCSFNWSIALPWPENMRDAADDEVHRYLQRQMSHETRHRKLEAAAEPCDGLCMWERIHGLREKIPRKWKDTAKVWRGREGRPYRPVCVTVHRMSPVVAFDPDVPRGNDLPGTRVWRRRMHDFLRQRHDTFHDEFGGGRRAPVQVSIHMSKDASRTVSWAFLASTVKENDEQTTNGADVRETGGKRKSVDWMWMYVVCGPGREPGPRKSTDQNATMVPLAILSSARSGRPRVFAHTQSRRPVALYSGDSVGAIDGPVTAMTRPPTR